MAVQTIRIFYILSLFVTLLTACASAGGLFIEGLYRDSEFYRTAWLGNDMVTLTLVVPLSLITLGYVRRGSERAQLMLIGIMAYTLYNYSFYLFGAVFNMFFLLYVSLFAFSIYGLIFGIGILDLKTLDQHFSNKTPVRGICIYLLLISLPLAIIEGSQCLEFIIHKKVPDAPPLIFALDLGVIVPNSALAAILIWQRRPWGFVLAAMMLTKGFFYGLVLVSGTLLITISGAGKMDPLFGFYAFIAFGGMISLIFLIKNLNRRAVET
jgi:hypothetical protein